MAISCIFANSENTLVLFTDNAGETHTVPIDWSGEFRMQEIDGGGIVGFLAAGGVIAPYVAPDAPPTYLAPSLYAVAQLSIADGAISGIDINTRLAGAFIMDVGRYYVFFTDIQPDTNYLAKAYNGESSAFISEANKFTDGFIITVVTSAGAPVNVPYLSLEIIRVS